MRNGRLLPLLLVAALQAYGCSVLFDGSEHLGDGTGACSGSMDCPGYAAACDPSRHVCVDCDVDDDGYLPATSACMGALGTGEPVDCDDTNPGIHPDVTPICGDAMTLSAAAACPSASLANARMMWSTTGAPTFAEAGRLPIAKLARVGSREYPFHNLSVAGIARSDGTQPEALVTFAGAVEGTAPAGKATLLEYRWDLAGSNAELTDTVVLNDAGTQPLPTVSSVAVRNNGLGALLATGGTGGDGTGVVQYFDVMPNGGALMPGIAALANGRLGTPITMSRNPRSGDWRAVWRELPRDAGMAVLRSVPPSGPESSQSSDRLAPPIDAPMVGSDGFIVMTPAASGGTWLAWAGVDSDPPREITPPSAIAASDPPAIAALGTPGMNAAYDYRVFFPGGATGDVRRDAFSCTGAAFAICSMDSTVQVPLSSGGRLLRADSLGADTAVLAMVTGGPRGTGQAVTLRLGRRAAGFDAPLVVLDTSRLDVAPGADIEDLAIAVVGRGLTGATVDILVAVMITVDAVAHTYDIWVTGLRLCTSA